MGVWVNRYSIISYRKIRRLHNYDREEKSSADQEQVILQSIQEVHRSRGVKSSCHLHGVGDRYFAYEQYKQIEATIE